MDDYLGGDGVAVVEWPEKCEEAVPEDHLEIRIESRGEETRVFTLTPQGSFRGIAV